MLLILQYNHLGRALQAESDDLEVIGVASENFIHWARGWQRIRT
jgi:hypothetical protein